MLMTKIDDWVRVLAVGDVVGRPGRRFLKRALPILKKRYGYDALVVNVENAAGGFGMTPEIYDEFLDMGIDVMTSGNHIFDKKGTETWIGETERLLRPVNFPPGTAGGGSQVFELENGSRLGVVNLMGRTFMKPYDCPFRAADDCLEKLKAQTPMVLVDFHGEATSEKMAMGWYVAGRASAVWGTHTHVPTADARILDNYTGFQSDLGMTGPYDSIIGMTKEPVLEGFLTLNRSRFEVAKGDPRLGGCILDIEQQTGRCVQLKSIFLDARQLDQIG